MSELTARQEEYLDALPQPSYQAWADAVGASESSAEEMRRRLTDENDDIEIEKVDGEWRNTFGDADDPEREDLNERETYIYRSLPKSAAAQNVYSHSPSTFSISMSSFSSLSRRRISSALDSAASTASAHA